MPRSSAGSFGRHAPRTDELAGHGVFGGGGASPAQRTVALVGHAGAGRTQLAEVLLHAGGVVRAPGAVDAGTSLLDGAASGPDGRGNPWPAFAWLPWRDAVVHLVDTPGCDGAAWPARVAAAGADAELLVVSGPDGVERGAEEVARRARREGRPLIAVVNKLDRAADVTGIADHLAELSGRRVLPLQLPLFEGRAFVGVIDLLGDDAVRYAPDGTGACSREPVPTDRVGEVRAAREALTEAIALTDDDLLEAYLERLDLEPEQAWAGLARAVREGRIVPLLLASAARGVGGASVLDAIVRLAPDPSAWRVPDDRGLRPRQVVQWIGTRFDEEGAPIAVLRVWAGALQEQQTLMLPRTGQPWKVRKLYQLRGPRRALAKLTGPGALVATWDLPPGRPGDVLTDGVDVALDTPQPRPPMAWLVVEPKLRRRRPELDAALQRLWLVDPSVGWVDEPDTDGVCLSGASAGQLEGWVRELRERFGLDLDVRLPPVGFVECPRAAVARVHGLHRRLEGSEVAELGEVWVDVEPAAAEEGWAFDALVDDDELPERFLPAVGEGARRALRHGPTAGYPVTGVRVRCTGGEYDALESTEAHFASAGELAVRHALEQAGTELLEPWHEVAIHIPGDDVGAVIADLGAHRSRVVGLEVEDEITIVQALVPETELRTLGRRLEGLTRGRGWFSSGPSHYDRVPAGLVGEAVASSPHRGGRAPVEAK